MSACCNRGSKCSLVRAMDCRIVRCSIISSCQSAATSKVIKRFWPRVSRVSSAIASTGLYTFYANLRTESGTVGECQLPVMLMKKIKTCVNEFNESNDSIS